MGRISSLWHISVYAFNTFVPFPFLHISIFMDFAAGEISLQQIPIWTEIDACAQSCALSASGYFSSSLQCPGTDPDSCLCTLGPTTQLAGLAHVCASKSCTSFLSYSADPERARAALTTYCEVNAAQRSDASISSDSTPISTSETSLSQTTSQSQAIDSRGTSYPTVTSTSATITTTTPPETSLKVVATYSSLASVTDSNSISMSSSASTSSPSQSSTASDSGLSRSDQIAIGIGVPGALFTLVGLYFTRKQRWPFAGQQKGLERLYFRISLRRSSHP